MMMMEIERSQVKTIAEADALLANVEPVRICFWIGTVHALKEILIPDSLVLASSLLPFNDRTGPSDSFYCLMRSSDPTLPSPSLQRCLRSRAPLRRSGSFLLPACTALSGPGPRFS